MGKEVPGRVGLAQKRGVCAAEHGYRDRAVRSTGAPGTPHVHMLSIKSLDPTLLWDFRLALV